MSLYKWLRKRQIRADTRAYRVGFQYAAGVLAYARYIGELPTAWGQLLHESDRQHGPFKAGMCAALKQARSSVRQL